MDCGDVDNKILQLTALLEKKSIGLQRTYFVHWKLYHNVRQKLVLQHCTHQLISAHFLQWYRFSRSRGKRRKNSLRILKGWKNAIDANRHDILLLGRAHRALYHTRARRCLHAWSTAMQTSILLHCYQTSQILRYVKNSPLLLLPPTFVHQNPRLLLIQYWKKWRLMVREIRGQGKATMRDIKKPALADRQVKTTTTQAKIWYQNEISTSKNFSLLTNMASNAWELHKLLQEPYQILRGLEPTRKKAEKIKTPKCHQTEAIPIRNNSVMDSTLQKVNFDYTNSKIGVDKCTQILSENRSALRKAHNDVAIQQRTIQVCTREIEHHCCKCGGIHVFSDHEPAQREGCRRLKQKTKSLLYQKVALKEALERVDICQSAVDDGKAMAFEARANMAALLSDGFTLIDSVDNIYPSNKS